jgi:hypothetical protein
MSRKIAASERLSFQSPHHRVGFGSLVLLGWVLTGFLVPFCAKSSLLVFLAKTLRLSEAAIVLTAAGLTAGVLLVPTVWAVRTVWRNQKYDDEVELIVEWSFKGLILCCLAIYACLHNLHVSM